MPRELASRIRELVRDVGALAGFLSRASGSLHLVDSGSLEVRTEVGETLGKAMSMVSEVERKSLEVLAEASSANLPPALARRVSEVLERALDTLRRVREIVASYLEGVSAGRLRSADALRVATSESLRSLEDFLRRYMGDLQRIADALEESATPSASL